MSTVYYKPEQALLRAQELKSINQEAAALEMLHEVLSQRRNRTWSISYEQIMIVYLDLCLDLSKPHKAKDGLHQYRNLSQTQAPGSLEKVIRYLMDKAEKKCTEAKASVDAATLASSESDDANEFGASPQAILMSTMSTDPAKSQRDSAILMPSLKFLWEIYRSILDILRSNSKLEFVYHAAAQGALRYCRTYKRRSEFRPLCDMLRAHFSALRQYGGISEAGDDIKSSKQIRGWEGWSADSIELHLQTRFTQLETASALQRYTEGFRTVEDIYNILQINHARRRANPEIPPPKAKLMATYYEKLTTLFWVSENYLFHAFAWYKYYSLCSEFNRSMSEEMKQNQASAVLLATLCIPPLASLSGKGANKQHGISSTLEDDIAKQKMARMATLLGFHTRSPSREALLEEIESKNLLSIVPSYIRELYEVLEESTNPLEMMDKARPLLDELKKKAASSSASGDDENLSRYLQPLVSVLLLRLMVNLSASYLNVKISQVKSLTEGLGLTFEQIEQKIIQFTQTKAVSIRIDHRAGCLRFSEPDLESDRMRSQLTQLAKHLQSITNLINPAKEEENIARRVQFYSGIRENLESEHQGILERKNAIEARKEKREQLAQAKLREEARLKAEEEAARKKEEESRVEREKAQREQEKHKKIQQELDNEQKKKLLTALGHKVDTMSEEEISKHDIEALQKEHTDKQNKKREEADKKTREAAKKLDYLVRAIRIEELPLIKRKVEEKSKQDKEQYEKECKERVETARKAWEADANMKERLTNENVQISTLTEFFDMVMVSRKVEHEALCKQMDEQVMVDAERAKIRRARERKEDELLRQEEEERRKREEEERLREEEEREKREAIQRQKEAEEEAAREAERQRMEDQRKRENTGKYMPPSMRNRGSDSGGMSRPGGGGYPGGGRYESNRSGGSGGGYRDERRGGYDRGGGYGDRRGGYGRDERRGDGAPSENKRWR